MFGGNGCVALYNLTELSPLHTSLFGVDKNSLRFGSLIPKIITRLITARRKSKFVCSLKWGKVRSVFNVDMEIAKTKGPSLQRLIWKHWYHIRCRFSGIHYFNRFENVPVNATMHLKPLMAFVIPYPHASAININIMYWQNAFIFDGERSCKNIGWICWWIGSNRC